MTGVFTEHEFQIHPSHGDLPATLCRGFFVS